jgi:hypothetical protein
MNDPRNTTNVPSPLAMGMRRLEPQLLFLDRLSSPTRWAARGGRAPCTPGQGIRPLEPRFDAALCRAPGAHACGQIDATSDELDLGATEACSSTVILALASIAGRVLGKPARVSLIGGARAKRPAIKACREREGRSPLAKPYLTLFASPLPGAYNGAIRFPQTCSI